MVKRYTKGKIGHLTACKSKVGNKKCSIYGIEFDSIGEKDRFLILLNAQNSGIITNLEMQKQFSLDINGVHIGKYTADFSYYKNGKLIVEDFKGKMISRDFPLRKKLMLAIHGIEIKIIKKPTESI